MLTKKLRKATRCEIESVLWCIVAATIAVLPKSPCAADPPNPDHDRIAVGATPDKNGSPAELLKQLEENNLSPGQIAAIAERGTFATSELCDSKTLWDPFGVIFSKARICGENWRTKSGANTCLGLSALN